MTLYTGSLADMLYLTANESKSLFIAVADLLYLINTSACAIAFLRVIRSSGKLSKTLTVGLPVVLLTSTNISTLSRLPEVRAYLNSLKRCVLTR